MIARPARGVGQRDAGAAAAEVAQHDDAVGGQSGRGPQAGQRRAGVGDQRRRDAAGGQARLGAQRVAQRADDAGAPVRGHGDRDRRAAADRAGHGVERLDEHDLAAVRRPVRRDQRDRVADALDEAGQDQPGLVGAREPMRRPRARGR